MLEVQYFEGIKPPGNPNKYWLLWVHREAIFRAVQSKQYSTVIYMEDDTYLSWSALQSWAADTEILAPRNFTRCFYRTEVSPATGEDVMLDWVQPLKMSNARTLDSHILEMHPFQHRRFLEPRQPFQGMWVANKDQLARFVRHPFWSIQGALSAPIWGYAEKSNSVNLLISVPPGHHTSCMVPYENEPTPRLAPLAKVIHLRNGYSSEPKSRHGKLKMELALQ